MKHAIFIFFILFLFSSGSYAFQAKVTPVDRDINVNLKQKTNYQNKNMSGVDEAVPPRILPIGDSITLGVSDVFYKGDKTFEDIAGYRDDLQDLLGKENYQFVGPLISPPMVGLYHARHAGYSGWTTKDVLDKLDSLDTLNTWFPIAGSGNLIIIHLGTNDCTLGYDLQVAVDRMREFIDRVQAKDSTINIIVCQITPLLNFPAYEARVLNLNSKIEKMVKNYTYGGQPKSNLYLVNMHDALKDCWAENTCKDKDLVHPNPAGYALMAQKLYDTITDLAPKN